MRTSLRTAGLAAIFLLAACGNSKSDATGQTGSEGSASSPNSAAPVAKADWMTPRGTMLGDIEIGNPNAKISVIEYASLTCPHCRRFNEETFEPFKKAYLETGKAKYVFRHFLLNQIDLYASMIARCGGPSRYYGLMDMFFRRQEYWADQDYQTKLAGLAARSGLGKDQIDACLKDPALQKYLVDSTMNGQKEWDISGTPTVIVNGQKQKSGEIRYDEFVKVLDAAANS